MSRSAIAARDSRIAITEAAFFLGGFFSSEVINLRISDTGSASLFDATLAAFERICAAIPGQISTY
jgi:hypothetical protein